MIAVARGVKIDQLLRLIPNKIDQYISLRKLEKDGRKPERAVNGVAQAGMANGRGIAPFAQ